MGFFDFLTNRPGEADKRSGLLGQGQAGANFAKQGATNYANLGGQLGTQADYLRGIQNGQNSLSAEQLRQSLGRMVNQQRSMAAGASPQNQAMAAIMASRNAMQLGQGMAGQQAMAGIAERNAAAESLGNMLLQQRNQDLNATLGGQQNATGAYGQVQPGQSWLDRFGGAITGAGSLYAMGGIPGTGPAGRAGGGQR